MAANKFATMLHKNTNKITLILIYAILEWILILLLLLNSLFSYIIVKFADYFGLKRPCLWCSRVDHIFDSENGSNLFIDLMCDAHANEISKLSFCSNHRKLAESNDMCEDCLSSCRPELSNKFAYVPLSKGIEMVDKLIENGEADSLECSCCGVKLEKEIYSHHLLLKPSLGVLDYIQDVNLIKEKSSFISSVDSGDDGDHSDERGLDFVPNYPKDEQIKEEKRGVHVDGGKGGRKEEEKEEEFSCFVSSNDCMKTADSHGYGEVDTAISEEKEGVKDCDFDVSMVNDETRYQVETSRERDLEIIPDYIQFYSEQDNSPLIQLELMGSGTPKSGNGDPFLDFDVHMRRAKVDLVVENRHSFEETVELLSALESKDEPNDSMIESIEFDLGVKESFSFTHDEEYETIDSTQATQDFKAIIEKQLEIDVHQVQVLDQLHNDEFDTEISIGTEIPDHERIEIDDIQTQENAAHLLEHDDHYGFEQTGEHIEFVKMKIETSETALESCVPDSDLHEIEEERIPDTPTSVDSFHQLHKRLLRLERKETGAEDSYDDSSVFSDIEGGDGVLTTEKLKSALKFERKALSALYAELEEERSASAVATNQTMAMINRLQEEKAAMQMEALHYQRMMEEQSEYDQEALQLMNELMVKREREKTELEEELEICRMKLQEYEAKEHMFVSRRRKYGSSGSRTSSPSRSINPEDSDGLSIDLVREPNEEDSFYNGSHIETQNTPVDAVLYLKDSLSNFEEERLSILEQLKVLESKLFTSSDEEDQYVKDIKLSDKFYEENGNGHNEDFKANGQSKERNGKHHQERRITAPKAKRLLPLFDAVDGEAEDGELNGNGQHYKDGLDSAADQNSSVMEKKRVAVEEEVYNLYERLQALESDREFLKHCISSLREGDKGIFLLQQILEHLRNLRSLQVRARNKGDGA